jgi:hypothetical protein
MTKDEAYNLIRTSQYMGEKRHFNFEKYLTIHIKAHQDLADNGEPMLESRKVREFLDHINCNEMEAGVANVLADEGKSENCIATANYHTFFACKQMSLSGTKTERDQLDQHPARTEVEGAEDMDLEKEDRDAEVPMAEVNETTEDPRREVPILLTPCGQNCHQLFSQ